MGTDTPRASNTEHICPHLALSAVRELVDEQLTLRGDAFAVAHELDLDYEVVNEHWQQCVLGEKPKDRDLERLRNPIDVTQGILDHLRQRISSLMIRAGIDGEHKELLQLIEMYNKTAINHGKLKREYGEEFRADISVYEAIIQEIVNQMNTFCEGCAATLEAIIAGEEEPVAAEMR